MFSGRVLDRSHESLALSLWQEAAAWTSARGLPIWDEYTFDSVFFEHEIARGEIIGVLLGSDLAAVALLHWSDDIWPPQQSSNEAAYVHKVVTARAFAGTEALGVLFETCRARARSAGKTLLRLDTPASRPMLQDLYRRLGFSAVGICDAATPLVLFEKRIS